MAKSQDRPKRQAKKPSKKATMKTADERSNELSIGLPARLKNPTPHIKRSPHLPGTGRVGKMMIPPDFETGGGGPG